MSSPGEEKGLVDPRFIDPESLAHCRPTASIAGRWSSLPFAVSRASGLTCVDTDATRTWLAWTDADRGVVSTAIVEALTDE